MTGSISTQRSDTPPAGLILPSEPRTMAYFPACPCPVMPTRFFRESGGTNTHTLATLHTGLGTPLPTSSARRAVPRRLNHKRTSSATAEMRNWERYARQPWIASCGWQPTLRRWPKARQPLRGSEPIGRRPKQMLLVVDTRLQPSPTFRRSKPTPGVPTRCKRQHW